MRRRRNKKKKHTALVIVLSVLGLMALFAISFVTFFKLLGGSFTSVEETTSTPVPTVQEEITSTPVDDSNDEAHWKTTATSTPTALPQPTKTPRPTVKPEEGDPAELRGGAYKYPTNKQIITEEELDMMSRSDIKIIYNEIYARHGMTFNDDELIDYFEMQQWYIPTEISEKAVEAKFSDIEDKNRDIIYKYQIKKGWRN